jgi:putative FmdB family regulatory protein
MPIYEYICSSCNLKFELRRSFSQADEAALCPSCHATAKKLLSSFIAFSKGAEGESSPIGGSACSGCAASSCASCNLS